MSHIDLLIAFIVGFMLGSLAGVILFCLMAMRGRDNDGES